MMTGVSASTATWADRRRSGERRASHAWRWSWGAGRCCRFRVRVTAQPAGAGPRRPWTAKRRHFPPAPSIRRTLLRTGIFAAAGKGGGTWSRSMLSSAGSRSFTCPAPAPRHHGAGPGEGCPGTEEGRVRLHRRRACPHTGSPTTLARARPAKAAPPLRPQALTQLAQPTARPSTPPRPPHP